MTGDRLPPHHANCLGCGDENPAGVHMRMRRDGERVRGEVTLSRLHEGAPGYAHGGAVSTVIDDALGMLLFVLRKPAVTAKLEVNFRRPAFLERPFEVEAWVESVDGRKLHLAAEVRDEGEVVADGSALFLEVDVEHFARGAKMSGDQGRPRRLPW
ncbi:MAG TPA: PaaI family thioesterase [Thermoleophilaceae bacterium]|jgi:acyl-coenzyme A thioesterase PaaI-like protein